MSAPDRHTQEAVALQLIAALADYEADVKLLCGSWLDMEHYQSVSQQVDDLRMYAAALPRVSVQWVAVLISHAELIHALWKAHRADADAAAVENQLSDHLAAIHLLSRAARLLVATTPATGKSRH
jgi:hypothetical protein